jgi:hypothetical protein
MWKWSHYFPIYERHLSGGKLLEIGVGSLGMWRERGFEAFGIDVDPGKSGEGVFIGDQGDRNFLAEVVREVGPFDVVVDDGSHRDEDIWVSFDVLFAASKVYLIEDMHCCERVMDLIERMMDRAGLVSSIHFYPQVMVFEKGKFSSGKVRYGIWNS